MYFSINKLGVRLRFTQVKYNAIFRTLLDLWGEKTEITSQIKRNQMLKCLTFNCKTRKSIMAESHIKHSACPT